MPDYLSFESDYIAGAHPHVLRRLLETNLDSLPGYGSDPYCAQAREKISRACTCASDAIHFLSGGTQTNQVVISTLLREYEGVIAPETGHIGVHEAGAIECTGHKVLPLPAQYGKLSPETLSAYVRTFYADANHEHMVFPGMVYLSQPTEYGTLYSLSELEAISALCRQYGMRLYIDGARLIYALCSPENDVTLSDLVRLCDAFYIGGTKAGLLCGEAVVFPGGSPAHFTTCVKRHGALLAKGRLLGVQFDALFSDDLYLTIGQHAITMSRALQDILDESGCHWYLRTPTNQQFVIFSPQQLKQLSTSVRTAFWESLDEAHTVVRLACSWSTTLDDLQNLRLALRQLQPQ